MKKFLAMVLLTTIFFAQSVKAKNYFVHSSYTENYRGCGTGLKQTTYIDSEKISRYAAIDNKGGLLCVGIIEIFDWDATSIHPAKQEVFRNDYFFYVRKNGWERSLFDGEFIRYTMTHKIPGEIVMGLKGDGIRCLVPRWNKAGHPEQKIFRDELVFAADGLHSDWLLLKIYNKVLKILK